MCIRSHHAYTCMSSRHLSDLAKVSQEKPTMEAGTRWRRYSFFAFATKEGLSNCPTDTSHNWAPLHCPLLESDSSIEPPFQGQLRLCLKFQDRQWLFNIVKDLSAWAGRSVRGSAVLIILSWIEIVPELDWFAIIISIHCAQYIRCYFRRHVKNKQLFYLLCLPLYLPWLVKFPLLFPLIMARHRMFCTDKLQKIALDISLYSKAIISFNFTLWTASSHLKTLKSTHKCKESQHLL